MTLLPRPSQRQQLRITGLMQLILLGILAFGLYDGRPKAITNGTIALLATFLPATLRRRYDIALDPWLALWITAAVFFHTLGSSGLYSAIDWWDHLTHALSASLVAGVGYTVARAVDIHHDEIYIPPRFAFVYIFVIVLSFGVLWELLEFGLDVVATETGATMPLAQHGLDDTVKDLYYNSVGALVVAFFGQVHLTDVAERLRASYLD